MEKSYNQRYKESNTTLSYKEWRQREDEKMASFDGVPNIQDSASYKKTLEEMQKKSGFQTKLKGDNLFGIKYNVLILGGAIILGVIAYKIYKKNK
jgi:hypothetical protein